MLSATILIVFIVGTFDLVFARTIYVYSDKSKQAYYYALIAVFAGLWSFSCGIVNISQDNPDILKWALMMHYFSGNFAFVSFYIFGKYFVTAKGKTLQLSLFDKFLLSVNAIGVFLPFMLGIVFFDDNTLNPLGYWIFVSSLCLVFISGLFVLIYGMVKSISNKRSSILFIFIANLLAGFIGIVFNLILPFSGNFNYFYISPMFVSFALIVFGVYSLVKFQVFNIKIVISELTVGLLLIISLYQFIKAVISGGSIVLESIFTFIIVIVGGLLMQSIHKGEDRRRQIEELVDDLKKANEQLKSLDKLKSEFISLASHQLRSPLTVIKGYASTLTDGMVGDLTPKQTEIVRHIFTSAQGLASVVEDFLNVTKIEQGGMKYVFTDTDIQVITKDLISDMKIAADDKHLKLTSTIEANGQYVMNADGVKLKQVFLNLIDNSIKYTQEGFVNISLSENINEGTITFSVNDSGIGISEETKAKLFTKFARGEGGALNAGGSGLGLYLAQEIVKAHKGQIIIESPGLGKGSTFSVVLPSNR